MTLKNKKNKYLPLLITVILLLQGNVFAQSEIPKSIKELLLSGVNIVDTAKSARSIEKAVDVFKSAVKLEPKSPEAHYYLGKTLLLLNGNIRNAINEYKKYLALSPDASDKESVEKEIADWEKYLHVNYEASSLGFEFNTLQNDVFVWKIYRRIGVSSETIKTSLYPGDKILRIAGKEITKSTIREVIHSILESSVDSVEYAILRGDEQLVFKMGKKDNARDPFAGNIGEADLKEIIAGSKAPLIVFWKKERDIYTAQVVKLLTIMEYRNPGKFSIIVVDMDINKILNEDYGINYDITPSAQVYENGKLTYTMAGKAQMSEFSAKLKTLIQ
jgi:tetratricopeptide (TPR) repeat protein